MRADLHTHTTASDGSMTPSEVVRRAKDMGIEVIAITDHDTVAGLEEARAEAQRIGIQMIDGIEISTLSICEIHILGYNIDYKNPDFARELQAIQDMRITRNIAIGKKLESLGIKPDIDFAVRGLGRMNMARMLVEQGFCKDTNEAFDKYLGLHGKAYCATRRITPKDAVKFIGAYGGFSSLAHPKKYLLDKRLEGLIAGLKQFGLNGLEVNYHNHTPQDVQALSLLCNKYRLLPTGGSDFHGDDDRVFSFDLNPKTKAALLRN